MPENDELVTILGVELEQGTIDAIESFKEGIDAVLDKFKALQIASAAFMAAGALFVKNAMDNAASLQTLADKSGLSTDALQEWAYAADMTGVSAQAVQADLVNLNKTMSSPIPGQFNMNFAMLGVSVRNTNGELKTSDELLGDVSEKFQGMSQQRAMQWGSKLGLSDDTVVLLRQGGEALDRLRAEAHEIGSIIPEEAIKRSEQFRVSLTKLTASFRGLSQQVAIAAMPALQRIVEQFTTWIQENRKWIALHTEGFMQGFVNALERVWTMLKRVFEPLKPVVDAFRDLTKGMTEAELWTHLITGALTGLLIVFSPLIAKIVAISAALYAANLVLEDLFTYFEGGTSVTGYFIDQFAQKWPGITALLKTTVGLVRDGLLAAFNALMDAGRAVGRALADVFGHVMGNLEDISVPLNDFITNFTKNFPAVIDVVQKLAAVIKQVLGFALEFIASLLKGISELAKTVFEFLLEKIAQALGKLNEFFEWLGFGGAKGAGQPQQEGAGTSTGPTPQRATMPQALQEPTKYGGVRRLGDMGGGQQAALPQLALPGQKTVPAASRVPPQINDNRTINQTIATTDPQQAANLALQGMGGGGAAAQINTPGLFAPVVR